MNAYVVVTNSGGVSEIAETSPGVKTLHIDYDDCNSDVTEAIRYAKDVADADWLPEERKRFYISEIFDLYPMDTEARAGDLSVDDFFLQEGWEEDDLGIVTDLVGDTVLTSQGALDRDEVVLTFERAR